MVNAITSFFHSLTWFITKFVKYTLVIVLVIYLLPKLFGLIEFAKYLGDRHLPVYREGYTLIDYDNHGFMEFADNRIHSYVFYYIHKQLEPRLVNHKESLDEAIDLKSFYAQHQDIISEHPFRSNYQYEEWDEWISNSKAIKIEDSIYLVNIDYKLGCDRFSCDFTSNYYLFQYDGETLRIVDSYLPGVLGLGGISHYKRVGDSVFIKAYDESTPNQTIELKL